MKWTAFFCAVPVLLAVASSQPGRTDENTPQPPEQEWIAVPAYALPEEAFGNMLGLLIDAISPDPGEVGSEAVRTIAEALQHAARGATQPPLLLRLEGRAEERLQRPSPPNILRALAELATMAKPEDRVFVLILCVLDPTSDREPALLLPSADSGAPERLPLPTLNRALASIPARDLIVILDAISESADADVTRRFLSCLFNPASGRLTIGSLVPYGFPPAVSPRPRGILSGHVGEGLMGLADLNDDGLITAHELFEYCSYLLWDEDGQEVPVMWWRPNGLGGIVLARNPSAVTPMPFDEAKKPQQWMATPLYVQHICEVAPQGPPGPMGPVGPAGPAGPPAHPPITLSSLPIEWKAWRSEFEQTVAVSKDNLRAAREALGHVAAALVPSVEQAANPGRMPQAADHWWIKVPFEGDITPFLRKPGLQGHPGREGAPGLPPLCVAPQSTPSDAIWLPEGRPWDTETAKQYVAEKLGELAHALKGHLSRLANGTERLLGIAKAVQVVVATPAEQAPDYLKRWPLAEDAFVGFGPAHSLADVAPRLMRGVVGPRGPRGPEGPPGPTGPDYCVLLIGEAEEVRNSLETLQTKVSHLEAELSELDRVACRLSDWVNSLRRSSIQRR